MREKLPYWRINRDIRASQVRLVDDMGVQVGIVPAGEALRQAETVGLDLVEVAPGANPPVCKIVDFAKFRYEQIRRLKETNKKNKAGELKEVRFTPTVHEHDLETKLKHIQEFLAANDKVRITVFFRGREIVHKDLGRRLIAVITERLKEKAKVDKEPMFEGKRLIMVLSPKR